MYDENVQKIPFIDSHTAGEPTRIILEGSLDLGGGSVAQQLAVFRDRYDWWRAAVVNEPRGSDVLVGALLCPPADPSCTAGVIYFNNVAFLGMCGHGTIGLMTTLAYLGRIQPGQHRIETPVGVVSAELHADGKVTVNNVPSYRYEQAVPINIPGYGTISGDIAWGGNWFFISADHGQTLDFANVDALTDFTWRVRHAAGSIGYHRTPTVR